MSIITSPCDKQFRPLTIQPVTSQLHRHPVGEMVLTRARPLLQMVGSRLETPQIPEKGKHKTWSNLREKKKGQGMGSGIVDNLWLAWHGAFIPDCRGELPNLGVALDFRVSWFHLLGCWHETMVLQDPYLFLWSRQKVLSQNHKIVIAQTRCSVIQDHFSPTLVLPALSTDSTTDLCRVSPASESPSGTAPGEWK